MASVEPRQKRSKIIRYSMNCSFSSEEAKLEFLKSFDRVKSILCRRSSKQLDNAELFLKLFDFVHDDDHDGNDSHDHVNYTCATQKQPKTSMLKNSGMILVSYLITLIIGAECYVY
jgi:hypothetical protein